jgi:hypothetical protein
MIVWDERDRGAGRGYWHKMGYTVDQPDMSAAEAVDTFGLNYQITKRAVSTRVNGKHHNIDGTFALVSDDPGATSPVIAIVGREFEPVQNVHLAELLDKAKLVGPGGLYSLDVVGQAQDGRLVFWSLKDREPIMVNGDEYRHNWLLLDGKDGNRALTLSLTPVRAVCSNAIVMAAAGGSIKVGISHTAAASDELRWWLNVAPQLRAASIKAADTLKALGKTKVTEELVTEVLEAAYPVPKVRGKAQLANMAHLKLDEDDAIEVDRAKHSHNTAALRQLTKINDIRQLFESYGSDPEERNIRGTLLGVVNAVADYENHRMPTNSREDAALSNLVGPRYTAQAAAMRAAVALVS